MPGHDTHDGGWSANPWEVKFREAQAEIARIRQVVKEEADLRAAAERDRDKYLAAFSEQFDQRYEALDECKRLWPFEERVEILLSDWDHNGVPTYPLVADGAPHPALAALRATLPDPYVDPNSD